MSWGILTDQRCRKEWFDHNACIGSIVEQIESLDSIETDWESHKNSWSCWGFSSNFADFADFQDFNWPGIKEGAVCSRRLYGKDSGGD